MKFSTQTHEKYTIIKLDEDKLNTTVAPELKSELVNCNTQGRNTILLNMENVNYADSSGLSAILIGHRICNNANGLFVLFNLQPHVQKLITISQLDGTLNIGQNKQEAIEMAFLHEIQSDLEDESEEE